MFQINAVDLNFRAINLCCTQRFGRQTTSRKCDQPSFVRLKQGYRNTPKLNSPHKLDPPLTSTTSAQCADYTYGRADITVSLCFQFTHVVQWTLTNVEILNYKGLQCF
jgi:hypothetical protein